jgi:hypothetical protein
MSNGNRVRYDIEEDKYSNGNGAAIPTLAAIEARLAATERALFDMKRRLWTTWAVAFMGAVGAFVLGLSPEARAQYNISLTNLHNRLMVVEGRTRYISVIGSDTYFDSTNVHIRNGVGATNTTNGMGNLIISYNEDLGSDRWGSHNLVVGYAHEYTSYGGIVAGRNNSIRAPHASITGGAMNIASGRSSSVTGGEENAASGESASVTGGHGNRASGYKASVTGGQGNDAAALSSTVSGGKFRDILNTGDHDWRAGNLYEDQ